MQNRSNLLFIHKIIKAFADSMIKTFLPVLILKNGGSLMLAMAFILLHYVTEAISNLALKKFLHKYSVMAIIFYTIPIIAIQLLVNLSMTWWLVIILGVLSGLSYALYNVPCNLLFTFSDKKMNVAKFNLSSNIGKFVFTIVSGYIIGTNTLPLWALSIVAILLYVMAIVPILYGYNLLKNRYNLVYTKHPNIDKKSYIKFHLFHAFFGHLESMTAMLLPVFLYVNNLTFEAVAIVIALMEGLKVIANILAQMLTTHNKAFVSILISIILYIVGTIVILTVKNAIVLYIFSTLISISFPFIHVPMLKIYCNKLKIDNYHFDGMTYRDVAWHGGCAIMYLPFFIFPSLLVPAIISMASAVGAGAVSYKILEPQKSIELNEDASG